MFKIIVCLILGYICWCAYTNQDFSKVKEDALEKLKNEKTIKTINSSRDKTQEDIYNVINN